MKKKASRGELSKSVQTAPWAGTENERSSIPRTGPGGLAKDRKSVVKGDEGIDNKPSSSTHHRRSDGSATDRKSDVKGNKVNDRKLKPSASTPHRRSADKVISKTKPSDFSSGKKHSNTSSTQRKDSADGKEEILKSKPSRNRRQSIDDTGLLEYEKQNRRRSNESRNSRKSKDDIGLDSSGQLSPAAAMNILRGLPRTLSNLDKFEKLLASHNAGKDGKKREHYISGGVDPGEHLRKSSLKSESNHLPRPSSAPLLTRRSSFDSASEGGSLNESDLESDDEKETAAYKTRRLSMVALTDRGLRGKNASERLLGSFKIPKKLLSSNLEKFQSSFKSEVRKKGKPPEQSKARPKVKRTRSNRLIDVFEPELPQAEYSRKSTNESAVGTKASEHKTEAGEATSEFDGSSRRRKARRTRKASTRQWTWKCGCCSTLLILTIVVTVIVLFALKPHYFEKDETAGLSATPSAMPSLVPSTVVPTPSLVPSTLTSMSTSSPLEDVAIVVIVQLDGKPEETGFSLASADNSTMYVSHPVGSLAGLQSEIIMEVINVPETTDLVFTITDKNGLCCTYGNGYWRVLEGTGDTKSTIISGDSAAGYAFRVGAQNSVVQIDGFDPNEYCLPCPEGNKDCGRCAWCNADDGFLPDEIYNYQCHGDYFPIPKKCFAGDKRFQLHNGYITAMAGCPQGFNAWPQLETVPEILTVCAEEAKCIKSFSFVEPNCDIELSGSSLVVKTCQDKVGGIPFGYSFEMTAPREKECRSVGDFADTLAQRCCSGGVAFCSMLDLGVVQQDKISPTPVPEWRTYAPTRSSAPTVDGHLITILIQLDAFPMETGLSITSTDGETKFLERPQGYYKAKSDVIVEKVQIPEGTYAIITLTDEEGDGVCCESGAGYFQVYSNQGTLILDEAGTFTTSVSKTFLAAEPETLPPTMSAAPTESAAPTIDSYPITLALQLDQFSSETSLSIVSTDGSQIFFEWPEGTFSGQPSSLVVETVKLPSDIEVTFRITDSGGDGFCCLYGDGSLALYAGESAEEEESLLAFEYGSESELSVTIQVGPANSRAPAATTTFSTVSSMNEDAIGPSSFSRPASDDDMEVTLVLQLDKYPAETGWSIDSSDGLTNYAARPAGYYEESKSQQVIETIYLPEGLVYQFTITDFMGDGICCLAGDGRYGLYEGSDIEDESTQLVYGNGDFGSERRHTFIPGKPKTPSPTVSNAPSVTTYPVEVSLELDGNSDQTGWYITSADGTLIIDRPPGYYAGNDTLTVVENIRLEDGEYKFSLVDSEGDGFCCMDGIGFYSLYSNGSLLLSEEARFGYSHEETFSVGAPSMTDNTVSKSALLRGTVPSSYSPKRLRNHVESQEKTP